jgi:hypothetical protein
LRIFFGAGLLEMMKAEYASRVATGEKCNDLSVSAQGERRRLQHRGEAPRSLAC